MADKSKKKLSIEHYKGVRDFYPKDQYIQNYIFKTMAKAAESFGYEEYSASILEPTELYKSKTSEEIVNEQTYTFEDRGGRRVTLRPEMTPTIARMIAVKRRDLAFPLRWYSIPNMFRYERPQRGRLREHWQLNCDLFGVSGFEADFEIMSLAHKIMMNFGAKEKDFVIKVSSRKILDKYLEKEGLDNEQKKLILKLLDKKNKIDNFEEQVKKIARKSLDFKLDNEDMLEFKNFYEIIAKNIEFDSTIVRGFDYYTGMIFEVFDTSKENNRSLFGGGRYDNLLEIFGEKNIPAVGFGMGDVTIHDFLETHDLLPKYSPTTNLYICVLNISSVSFVDNFADKLREKNINIAIDWSYKKVGDQIKNAGKLKIPFVVCIGENEVNKSVFLIKNLYTGEEKKCKTVDEVATLILG